MSKSIIRREKNVADKKTDSVITDQDLTGSIKKDKRTLYMLQTPKFS